MRSEGRAFGVQRRKAAQMAPRKSSMKANKMRRSAVIADVVMTFDCSFDDGI